MKKNFMRFVFCLVVGAGVAAAPVAFGANGRLRVDYKVKLASIPEQLFHVTADIKNIRQPFIDVSLPCWIPGLYKMEDYAKNIQRLKVTDGKGNNAGHRMTERQSWRIETTGTDRVIFEFDYLAETLAVNQAKITSEFGFFTGVQMLVKVEGCSDREATVKIEAPEGWRVVSGLKEGGEANTFVAANYDELVDAPTQMGKFDLDKFEVGGKAHYLVSTPAGAYEKGKREQLVGILGKIAAAQGAIFGDLPYDKYVYFYFHIPSDWKGERSLGCLNSQIDFVTPGQPPNSYMISYVASHEFFHLWNLERIRPAEIWKYDYSRMTATSLLWMSEGFTNYFARLSRYRAGIDSRDQVLNGFKEILVGTQASPARGYMSPADASVFSWTEYEASKPFNTSPYAQGEIIAMMLDISMRKDTSGVAKLDDVMRALYSDSYKKGKGFSLEDLIAIINRLTKRDYTAFFNKYVFGVEDPPYNEIMAHAGYQLEKSNIKVPSLGLNVAQTPDGPKVSSIVAGSPAADTGLVVGDLLLTIDEMNVHAGLSGVREWLTPKIGQIVQVDVRRNGENKTLSLKVGYREAINQQISELPVVTPNQIKMREEWLKKGF